MPEKWMRQPGESAKAFRAFRAYLELGADRTLAKLAENQKCIERIPKIALLKRWSAKNAWVSRAEAHDAWISGQNAEAKAKLAAEHARQWAEREESLREAAFGAADKMMSVAAELLKIPLSNRQVEETRNGTRVLITPRAGWNLGTVAKIAALAWQLGRAACKDAFITTDDEDELDLMDPVERLKPH